MVQVHTRIKILKGTHGQKKGASTIYEWYQQYHHRHHLLVF